MDNENLWGIYYYFKNGLKIKMVQMKTKIVPTKILKQYLYYLKYHHIEINEFHNDHIYNKDVNITSDPIYVLIMMNVK